MQVSAAQSSSPWSSLATPNRQPAAETANDPAITGAEAAPVATPETDTVSLHNIAAAANPAQKAMPNLAPEVFAEIWKDGMKIGTVYTDGQAILPNTPGGMSGGGSGATFAYIRAQEVAQQVGGEVHYVNIPALQVAQTRTQLRAAYAA